MAPRPHLFRHEAELVKRLQSKRILERIRTYYSRKKTLESIIKWQVSSNTYRAFRKSATGVGPSIVFRAWIRRFIRNSRSRISRIQSQRAYDAFVDSATNSLRRHWKAMMRYDIGYGRAAKLINLVMKVLPIYDDYHLSSSQRKRLIGFLHVPLDSYTIQGLRNVAAFHIPVNASMRFIDSRKTYVEFQKLIRRTARKARVPAICYDILAWDLSHT